jgi:ABC-2 type transport system ATP-binding protein
VSPAVDVRSLRVVRGGRLVLDDVSLTVEPGTVTGLLGPSGCGKTTLMRSIVGVQIVAGGEVTVLGRPAGSPELRSAVGYVTQAPSVYRDLTVGENLRYFARVLNAPEARIRAALETVGMPERADSVVAQLSGGQQARVSLAAALVGDPRVLILDEPTVGLDPLLRRELWAAFHRLADGGATLFVSSHVMDEAAHCDQLVLMRDGRVLASATPAALLADTRADDLEGAFLTVIERQEVAA